MPAIAQFTMTVFNGRMMKANRQIALVDPEVGVDGNAVVKAGWRATPVQVETITEVTGSATVAASTVDQYYSLEGQVISVTDQFGAYWPNVTVLGVSAIYSASQTANIWVVRASWRLLPETTRPSGAIV